MNAWRRFHDRSWYFRQPLKLIIFLVVLVVVMYPNPLLFGRWLQRLQDMGSTLDPQYAGLQSLEQEVHTLLAGDTSAASALLAVEQVVHLRLPYAHDWDTWGVMDYLPTVDEALRLGREDCDGRAVVAASLLRRMNYDAELVSDLLHVWVHTPQGQAMNPTSAERTLVSGESGTQLTITTGMVKNLARGFSYGIGAFPLGREIILLVTIALLSMQPRSSFWRRVSGCLLLWIALMTIRDAGIKAAMQGESEMVWQVSAGFAVALAGWLVLVVRSRRRFHREVAENAQ